MTGDLQNRVKELYDLNRDDLYAYLIRNMRDESVALDLLQDAFLNFYNIFQNRELPGTDTECRMYLFKIVRNLMINFKSTAYQRKVDLVDHYDIPRSGNQAVSQSVEEQYLEQLDQEQSELVLQEIMALLSEQHRSLLHLRYNARLKLEEIASIMDLGVSTVSRQIKKAERLLADICQKKGYRFKPE